MEDCSNDPERLFLSRCVASIREEIKVAKIHEREHLSSRHYLDDFKIPLIEETRTRILSSLNSISESEYYKLLCVPVVQSDGLIFIDMDTIFGKHIAQDGDVFLLSNQEPKQLPTLDVHPGQFLLATGIGQNNRILRGFTAKTSCHIDFAFKYAIFMCNINEDMQIWKTLHMSIEDRKMIKIISSPSLMSNKSCRTCPTPSLYATPTCLNEEQVVLARNIVSNSCCDQCEGINVVWGLPGTGKTKVLAHVLAASCHSKVKMLVCAPDSLHLSSLCCHLSDELKGTANLHHGLDHGIGDVLLLTDSIEMRNTTIKEFCLDWRLKEIMPCMTWRGKLLVLVAFLEKGFRKSFEGVTKDTNPQVLKTSLRELFKRKSRTLVDSLKILQKYTPCHTLSLKAAGDLAALNAAVEKFNDLLAKESTTGEDVMSVFKINVSQAKSSTSRRKLSTSIKSSNKPSRASATQSHSSSTSVADLREARDNCINCLKKVEKNFKLPYEKNIEWMRRYLIEQSTVILSLPPDAFLLHTVDTKHLTTLIAIGAARIKECELLPALSLPSIKHVWLIGDHNQICPSVNSKMNEGSGLELSLFQRLVSLQFINQKLTIQYRMHPVICDLLNKYFYAGKLSSAKAAVSSNALNFGELGNYTFVNVQADRVLDAIQFLISTVVKAWEGKKDLNLQVGVICSTGKQYAQHCDCGPISLSFQSIDKIEVKDYDILITSANGLPTHDNHINYIITRARQHLWIVGDETELIKDAVWENLIHESKQQGTFIRSTSHKGLSAIIENQDIHVNSCDSLCYDLRVVIPHEKAPPREFTWVNRLFNGKFLLPPVRDQRTKNHCTLHSCLGTMEFLNKHKAASNIPAEDCPVKLATDKLLEKYEKKHGKIGQEKDGKGRRRLLKVLNILEKEGAICMKDNKVYKISSYVPIYDSHDSANKSLDKAAALPRKGKAFVGSFPLSRNYTKYKPGDIYEYDNREPILTPWNSLATHAVMVIGCTEGDTEMLLKDGYFVIQNSHGDYFGEMGICRVAAATIELLYEIDL